MTEQQYVYYPVMVLWSGGLDSTAALYKMLRDERERDVFAVWMDYSTAENRRTAEMNAIRRLMPKLQAVRPFMFIPVGQDFGALPRSPTDLHVYSFVAAQVARTIAFEFGKKISAVVSGLMRDDRDESWAARRAVAEKIMHACFSDIPPLEPRWEFPVFDMTKADEIRLVGVDIYRLTWSCRTPVVDPAAREMKRCGACSTCQKLAIAEAELGIENPEQRTEAA